MKRTILFFMMPVFLMSIACNVESQLDNGIMAENIGNTDMKAAMSAGGLRAKTPEQFAKDVKSYLQGAECQRHELILIETSDPLADLENSILNIRSNLDGLYARTNKLHKNHTTFDMEIYNQTRAAREKALRKSYDVLRDLKCLQNPETTERIKTKEFVKSVQEGTEFLTDYIKDLQDLHCIINPETLSTEKRNEWVNIDRELQNLDILSVNIDKFLTEIKFEVPAVPEVKTEELGWFNPADPSRLFKTREETPEYIARHIRLKNESIRKRLEDAEKRENALEIKSVWEGAGITFGQPVSLVWKFPKAIVTGKPLGK